MEGREQENIFLADFVSLEVLLMAWFVNRVKQPLKLLLIALFL